MKKRNNKRIGHALKHKNKTPLGLIKQFNEPENMVIVSNNEVEQSKRKNAMIDFAVFNKLEIYLSERYEFRRNIVTGRNEGKKFGEDTFVEVDKNYRNSILREARQNSILFKKDELQDLLCSDFVAEYDPFVEYVQHLPEWKEGDRDYIQELSNSVTLKEENNEYWQFCLKKWLVAAIGCLIEKDIVNESVLVFSGPQGIGKTRWITNLLPTALNGHFYSGIVNPNNKDSIINCAECFIVNMDELSGFIEKKSEDFKQLITNQIIRVRRPYNDRFETIPRRCSFVGSTNEHQFLYDNTGSRRVLAFEVTELNLPEFPIDFVWAQAFSLLESGFRFWFNQDEIVQLTNNNQKHQVLSIEEELVVEFFEPASETVDPDISFSTSNIIQFLGTQNPVARRCNVHRFGKVLHSKGYRPRKSNGSLLYDLKLKNR